MYAAWRVAVQLTATNMTGSAFNAFISHTSTAHNSVTSLQAAMSNFRSASISAFKDASGALTTFVSQGLSAAGKFQQEMTTVFNVLNATGATRDKLQAMVIDVSSFTRQDPEVIAREMAAAGQAGLTSDQILHSFKTYAKYADLQMVGPGHEDPVNALKTAIQVGHLEGAYKPEEINKMVERLNKLGYTQPESMEKVLTQGKYFIQTSRGLGMSIDDTLDLTAMMGQNGLLRGRGGTGIANVINGLEKGPAELTSRRGLERMAALTGLGIVDKNGHDNFIDKNGHIQITALIADLAKMAEKENNPSLFYKQLAGAFSSSALPFLFSVTAKATQDQIKRTQERTHSMGSIDDMFRERQGNYDQQMATLKTNWDLLVVATFLPALQYITPLVTGIADQVRNAAVFLTSHPAIAKAVALGLVGVGIAMGAATAIAASSMWTLIGSINALAVASGRTAGANLIGSAVGSFGGGGVARGVGGVLGAVFNPFNIFGKLGMIAKAGLAGLEAILFPGVRGALQYIGLFGRRIGGALAGGLGRFLLAFSIDIANVLPWIGRMGMLVGGFGLRMIPVVGWVTLAVQALLYFHKHPVEIGKWVGTFIGFIRYHLIPDSVKAIQSGGTLIVNSFSSTMQNIWKTLTSIFHPVSGKNLFEQLGDDYNKFKKAADDAQNSMKPPTAGGKGSKAGGDRRTSHTVVHKHEVSLKMNKKEVARIVIDHVNGRSASSIRAGNGSTASPRTSPEAYGGYNG